MITLKKHRNKQMVDVDPSFTLQDVGINADDITSFMKKMINKPNRIGGFNR